MYIRFNELSATRVFSAIKRRIYFIYYYLAWLLFKKNTNIPNKKHDDVVIVCNGPSLSDIDFSRFSNVDFITMNRSYLSFEDFKIKPRYHVCINKNVLKQFSKDLSEVEPFKFYNFECNRYFKTLDIKNNFWIMPSYSLFDKFSTEINKPMTSGGTVTFIALQIAAHLKYKRIFIIGMDHNFDSTSKPNLTEKRIGKDNNHFRPDYFPEGMVWDTPDLYRSEEAYKKALTYFKLNDTEIFDCTINGKCDVFEKRNIKEFF